MHSSAETTDKNGVNVGNTLFARKIVIYRIRKKMKRRVQLLSNLQEGVLQEKDAMQMPFSNGLKEVSVSLLDLMKVIHMHLFHPRRGRF